MQSQLKIKNMLTVFIVVVTHYQSTLQATTDLLNLIVILAHVLPGMGPGTTSRACPRL